MTALPNALQEDDVLTTARLIPLSEAARLTSTSPAFWRRLTATGTVPSVKLGRTRRIRREDLDAIVRLGVVTSDCREPAVSA
jgi:excisionase family DNA binding protein